MRALAIAVVTVLALGVLSAAPALAAQKPVSGEEIVATASKYKGVRYKYGGASPKGFDCSGLVWYVYKEHGYALPRTADKQFEHGKPVKTGDLRPGDVVFFTTTEKGASHCGIFTGQGKFIHASSSKGVIVTAMSDRYWKGRYLGARRML